MQFIWFSYHDAAHMEQAYALRTAVFVDEQGFAQEDEYDEQDKTALHVLGMDETGAVCCVARLFSTEPGVWHAGRIVVRKDLRGQGVGRLLMEEIAAKARSLGGKVVELGAQIDKQGFYASVGFTAYGEEFLDAGYPHMMMKRAL